MDDAMPPPVAAPLRRDQDLTRNPVLALPSLKAFFDLPVETRELLEALLRALAHDASCKAEHSWRRRKAPMAAYWHAIAVYARHIARAISPGRHRSCRRYPSTRRAMAILVPFPRRPAPSPPSSSPSSGG